MDTPNARIQQPLRQPLQTVGRTLEREDNLKQIEDYNREKEELIQKAIADSIEQLVGKSNKLFMDFTQQAVSERISTSEPSYRVVHTQMPISPPASTGGETQEAVPCDTPNTPNTPLTPSTREAAGTGTKRDYTTAFEIPNKEMTNSHHDEYQHQYRRRIGRGGRLWVDRKGLRPQNTTLSARDAERWKYDQDSDDDEQLSIYEADPYSTEQLNFRSNIELMGRATAQANYQGAVQRALQGPPQPAPNRVAPNSTSSNS